jgi:hypothetical protein
MVQFIPLNITDEHSIEYVLSHADNAIQYGEDLEPKEPKVGATALNNSHAYTDDSMHHHHCDHREPKEFDVEQDGQGNSRNLGFD